MRHGVWRLILATYRDVHGLTASAVGDYPASEPPQTAEQRAQRAWQAQPTAPAATTTTTTGTRQYPDVWPGAQAAGSAAVPVAAQAPTADKRAKLWTSDNHFQDAGVNTAGTTAAVVQAYSPEPAPALSDAEQAVLSKLQRDVLTRIAQLEDELAMETGHEHIMRALVYYFDEFILAMIPEYLRLNWTLLQVQRYGTNTGGEDFFRQIKRLENLGNTPALVFEVHYFCLNNGFQGKYAGDLDELENWQQRLRTHITMPERPTVASPAPRQMSVDVMRSPLWYYLAAVVLVVVCTALLTALSN